MGYRNLPSCLNDLETSGQLLRVDEPLDARLEVAEVHRRVFRSQGPALLFTNVAGCSMPLVSNLFGTRERAKFLFRDTWSRIRQLMELKADPHRLFKRPLRHARLLPIVRATRPRRVSRAPVLEQPARISELPHIVTWPQDGGAFITLPLVYTEDPDRPGPAHANLGMYRIQISGGDYEVDREVGMHYQIHRGIGVHHTTALRRGEALRVNIFVGGSPAMMLAAVMPLPEGISELVFAGALGGHRIPLYHGVGAELPIYAEADVCIQGTIIPDRLLPEGPFGDHLGYYCRAHPFPVLKVERVTRRRDAVWPFTVVGRPPQEDTIFGELIHSLTAPVIPSVVAGVRAVHAVDAAGVHPLLLAIGSERYTPYQPPQRPQELLTQANAILGQGQMSLAKYLLIVNGDDDPGLRIHDVAAFLQHLLVRIDWQRDLHFQTCTTIDTLDYSGAALHKGSKVVWAAAGPVRRTLPHELPQTGPPTDAWYRPRVVLPGVLVFTAEAVSDLDSATRSVEETCRRISPDHPWNQFPLWVLVDDSDFAARSLDDFLWVTFTRSDPARDTHGIGAFSHEKHWGCLGTLVIDARLKPQHPDPLKPDPATVKKIDALAARGGPLAKYL